MSAASTNSFVNFETPPVHPVALSPDGSLVASGSWNGEVKVWKVADGKIVKEFNGSPGLHQAAAAETAATK